ncbi:MAG: amidohydrolase family protein [Candidatus Rokuibacteriota bacterium]
MSQPRSAIDIHTHIMPPDWEDLAKKHGAPGWPRVRPEADCKAMIMLGDREFRLVTDRCFSAPRRLADMDRDGIRRQLISPIPVHFCYWGSPAVTAEFARIQNDFIAETVARHPARFIGAGTVAMQSVKHALPELDRMKAAGFRALEIGTNVNGRDLDDPDIVEILEAAQALGLAVFVHPWSGIGEERMRAFYLPHMVGLPAETSLAISRLIFGGVLDRLPELRIAFAHGGGTFIPLLGRIDHGFEVRPEAKQVISRRPSTYLRRLYVDSITHDPRLLELLCEKAGSDRVMLGSDYPFDMGVAHPLDQLTGVRLTPEDTDNVLFRSARRFLGLGDA